MAYITTSLIIDGALDEERYHHDQQAYESYVEDVVLDRMAGSIGQRRDTEKVWQLYRIEHDHDPAAAGEDGCDCVQYLQDHKPALTLGQESEEEA